MGYHTEFIGRFSLDKKLEDTLLIFLKKFSETRRMKRNVDAKYGVEGEFYVDGTGDSGQGREDNIVEYNNPPRTQPGLWCQWIPSDDGMFIEWDGDEKFYDYIAWLKYIISNFLAPKGYILNGEVKWEGEESSDMGIIVVTNNVVTTKRAKISYE